MKRAIAEAEKAFAAGEVPVGAILIDGEGEIIASTHNLVEKYHDVTAHAEMLALREGFRRKKSKYLDDCDIYVTLEPCPMCAQAISMARIRRLYFGAYDPKSGGVEHGTRTFAQSSCHHVPEIIGGIREGECAALLQNFFKEIRQSS